MSEQDLTLLDETFPKGDIEPVSVLDNYQRETRRKLKAFVDIEHDLATGTHTIASSPAFTGNGRIYYDEPTGELRYFRNSVWRSVLQPPFNYIYNPEFVFAPGVSGSQAPSGWAPVMPVGGSYGPNNSTSFRYFGRNSFQINMPAGAVSQGYIRQTFSQSNPRFLPIDYWRGRTVSLGCYVWCDQVGRAFLQINDNITASLSPMNTAAGVWEWLVVQHVVSSGATDIGPHLIVNPGAAACTSFYSMPTLVEGGWCTRPLPQGHPQRSHVLTFGTFNAASQSLVGSNFYGPQGRSSNEFLASVIIPYRFVAHNLFASITAFPGAGQTCDFRVRYNNTSDSAITCSFGGTSTNTAFDETHQLEGDANGTLSLRLTGTAGVPPAVVFASLVVDELPW